MRSEFEKTGLTFSEEGSPYCPVERKRRGAGALLAAMAVLALGAGLFGYTLLGETEQTSQDVPAVASAEPPPSSTPVPSPQDIDGQDLGASATPPATPEPAASPEDRLAEARAAIAQSRAARTRAVETADAAAAAQTEATQAAWGPRLKPVAAAQAAPLTDTPRTQPLRLDDAWLAAAEDRPPLFFFAGDMERRETTGAPTALAFAGDVERDFNRQQVRIARGENFVDALKRAGVSAADSNAAAYAFGKHYNLRRLLPGQEFALTLSWPNQTLFQLAAAGAAPQPRLIALDFRPDPESHIALRRGADGAFAGEKHVIPLTIRTMAISGIINGSLYVSAKAVGAPDEIIADLADAFSYDVDFQREIFGGDEFEAIFEVKYDDRGARVAAGDLVYARLNWRGRKEEKGYYRFASAEDGGRADFYDAAGQSARRLLMKTPIDGARLSSGFGMRRHPILGYRRAHRGVDFAAPRGTPIKAAGDGVIERADWYGGFGNYIRIRHANGYKTAYAHLKGFRSGIRKGRRVRQGDIIGYVGTTGRSTGPHLHYEVHLNGKAVNPQRLKIAATGKTLTGAELERFKAERDRIDAMRMPAAANPPLFASDEETGAESAL